MASTIISLVAKWCGFVSYWLAAAALYGLLAASIQYSELNQPSVYSYMTLHMLY